MSPINIITDISNLSSLAIFKGFPGYLLIKDLHSNYIFGNNIASKEFGVKYPEDLYGLTDFTIKHQLAEHGQFFINLDQVNLKHTQILSGIYAFPFHGVIQPFIFNKFYIYNQAGNKVAIFSHAMECKDATLTKAINQFIYDCPINHQSYFKAIQNCYQINGEFYDISLTHMQSHCFFYFLRKKTVQEIAEILHLPLKITQFQLEIIKNKMQCQTDEELLEKSIAFGYLNILPCGILKYRHDLSNSLPNTISSTFLSKQQLACAKLLLLGKSIKEISVVLHLSPRTIETYINHLKIKLSCRNKIELIIKLKEMSLN